MIESGGITWLFHDESYPYTGAIWAIKEAIELVGLDKLMRGSDYPRTIAAITYRMSYDFVEKSKLLDETEKKIISWKEHPRLLWIPELKKTSLYKKHVRIIIACLRLHHMHNETPI